MLDKWRDFIIDLEQQCPALYKKHSDTLIFITHKISMWQRIHTRLDARAHPGGLKYLGDA